MTQAQKTEALQRAGAVAIRLGREGDRHAAETVRAMSARILELENELRQRDTHEAAIGAGGVEPLRPRQCPHQISEPAPAGECAPLQNITSEDRSFLHYNPNTDDVVEWVQTYARHCIDSDRTMRAAQPDGECPPLPRKAGLDDHSILPEPGFSASQMHAYYDLGREHGAAAQPPRHAFVTASIGTTQRAFEEGWNACVDAMPATHAAPAAVAAPSDPSITLDFKMATELLEMFGGEPGLVTLQMGGEKSHSGAGLYAYYSELPEEGAEFLGAEPDDEAAPQPPAEAQEPVKRGEWLWVPETPTTGMLVAGNHGQPGDFSAAKVWRDMTAAAIRSAELSYTRPIDPPVNPAPQQPAPTSEQAGAPASPRRTWEGLPFNEEASGDVTVFMAGKAAGRQEVKDAQASPDFRTWINRAYSDAEATQYTIHNMEVAYQAGRTATASGGAAPAAQGDAWSHIYTLPDSDDLVWLYCKDTNTIDGPVAPRPSMVDSWTHWAPAEAPSTVAIDSARAQAQQGGA